jgi:hypothetical protein
VSGLKTAKISQVVNFTTRCSNRKWLSTRNMKLKSVMDTPDNPIVQECLQVTEVVELKKRHDAGSAALGTPISPPRDIHGLFEEYEADYQGFLSHQVQRGILKLSPKGDTYFITDKTFNRGILNFFNPFAHRLSLATVLFSVLIGDVDHLYSSTSGGRLGPGLVSLQRFGVWDQFFCVPGQA